MVPVPPPEGVRSVPAAFGSTAVEQDDPLARHFEPELLAVPPAPAAVGCVVEGRNDFSADALVLGKGDRPIAALSSISRIDPVWGIPREVPGAKALGAWVHAQSEGVAVTGHLAPRALRLQIARDVPVVEGHAWILAGSEVEPLSAGVDGKVSVAPIEDFEGTERLRGRLPCAALAERFVPAEESAAAPETPTESLLYAKRSLALRAAPGGRVFATIETRGVPLHEIGARGGYWRVRFDTKSMRFDAWVEAASVARTRESEEGGGRLRSCHCRNPGVPPKTHWRMRRTTEVRLGIESPETSSVAVTLAGGTPVWVVDRVGAAWAVSTRESGIKPPEEQLFWVSAEDVDYAPY